MKEDILKKVKKLLALAASCNEHEARLATEKAQALMLRHNLAEQSLHTFNDYVEHDAETRSTISRESGYIMKVLTRFFFVRCFYDKVFAGYSPSGKRKFKKISKLVGTKENIEVAGYVYAFLMQTYKSNWKEYSTVNSLNTAASRNSYMFGLTAGLMETLATNEKNVCAEMGLTVIPDAKLGEFLRSKFKLKARSVGRLSGDGKAQAAGTEQGKKIKISRALNSDSSNNGRLLN